MRGCKLTLETPVPEPPPAPITVDCTRRSTRGDIRQKQAYRSHLADDEDPGSWCGDDDAEAETRYVFGPCELLPRQRSLLKNGVPTRIGSRALDILSCLVSHAGETVAPQELIQAAWPNLSVDYSNLKVNIAQIRRIIDGPAERSAIIAIPGRGYRFVAPVRRKRMVEHAPLRFNFDGILPAAVPLFGRTGDLKATAKLLDAARVVTVVGPGGIGKSALAIAAAASIEARFPAGIAYVDFADVDDPSSVSGVLAASLGGMSRDRISQPRVAAGFSGEARLIVVDNCEHLMPGVAVAIEELVRQVESASILATSREPLRLRDECAYRVKPLAMEPCTVLGTVGRGVPAVELFLDRASRHAFLPITSSYLEAIVEICRRLEGNPLGIELAAARAGHLSATQMRDLAGDERLLLDVGPSSGGRHRSMRAVFEASLRLLSTAEREVLLASSLFPGEFSLDAACAVTRLCAGYALDLLLQLARKSLLEAACSEGSLSFIMSTSTRVLCLGCLSSDLREPLLRRRHAEIASTVADGDPCAKTLAPTGR